MEFTCRVASLQEVTLYLENFGDMTTFIFLGGSLVIALFVPSYQCNAMPSAIRCRGVEMQGGGG